MSDITREIDSVVNVFKTYAIKTRYILSDFNDVISFYGGEIDYTFQHDISVNPRLVLHLFANHDQVNEIQKIVEEKRPRIKFHTLYRVGAEEILLAVDYDLDWESSHGN